MEHNLLNRIEGLSPQERKLVLYKLKHLINDRGTYSPSEVPKKLVAYIRSTDNFDNDIFKSYLKERLPSYMIPSSIHLIDEIPLLPNGKIDKISLSKLSFASKVDEGIQQPRTEIETQLVKIWEEVLDYSPIGINDSFFEIGGDSMTSIRMFWLIEKKMKIKLPPTTLFSDPTIESIAKKLTETDIEKKADREYIIPLRTKGTKHPLFCIHGGEGHVLFYKTLPEYLDRDRPVYLVQPKGIDGKGVMHSSIEQMSEEYLSEIVQIQKDGPYNFLFYCCSALVVEIATQLQKMDKNVTIIIVDSSPKLIDHVPNLNEPKRSNLFIKKLTKYPLITIRASFTYRYRQYLEPYYMRLTKDKIAQRLIRIRQQLQKVQNQYQWHQFDAQCTLISAENQPQESKEEDINSWKFWCKSEVKILYNSGNHYNLFEKPHVEMLGKNVEEVCL